MTTFRLFQVGFNKCATSALFGLFSKAGVMSLHGGGRKWRLQGHPAIHGRNPQLEIQANMREGRLPLEGFEDFQAFFDMEYAQDLNIIENFREYPAFARAYPHAKFILNIRDRQDWLRSRLRHNNGKYLVRAMKRRGLDQEGVTKFWSDDFERHNTAVREFFAAEADRLLVFDIDNDDVSRIVDFVKPDVKLYPRHWRHTRVTDLVAKKLNWSEPFA